MPENNRADLRAVVSEAADLGAVVRAKRKADGLTQRELADILGIGDRVIRELEKGKDTIQLGKALVILRGLGLEVLVRPRGGE